MCSIVLDNSFDPDRPDWGQTPLEELGQQICEFAADLAAATCRWLALVAEFDARGGWSEWGVNSCAHWLSWRCGIGLRTARDHTRVARALGALPLVTEHFARGQLSYSKVRAITRVAQPETEADLVEMARHATGAQLDRIVRGYESVIRATREQAQRAEENEYLTCGWGDDGMLHVQGRLAPENGVALLQGLDAADSDDPATEYRARRVRALVALATGGQETATEIVVHVDAATLPREEIADQCIIEDGPSIAPEVARRLACEASLSTIIERDGQPLAVGRKTRTITRKMRRALKRRDDGCRFPGCTNTRYLQAHHIEHWAHGGKTELGNLIQLCPHHHRLVHEGGYGVALGSDAVPRFCSAGGWEIPPVGEPAAATGVSVRWRNQRAGIHVDADTGRPLSAGDRVDYGIAVEGLARKWLPPPRGLAA